MTCPLLHKGVIFGVDKLDTEISYTVDTVPHEPILRKYVDGGSKRQFQFVFASREAYGEKVLENLENSGFYEKFADWLEKNNQQGVFPDLGEFRSPYRIEILSSGYAFDTEDDSAQYQIQLALYYYQSRRYYNG